MKINEEKHFLKSSASAQQKGAEKRCSQNLLATITKGCRRACWLLQYLTSCSLRPFLSAGLLVLILQCFASKTATSSFKFWSRLSICQPKTKNTTPSEHTTTSPETNHPTRFSQAGRHVERRCSQHSAPPTEGGCDATDLPAEADELLA